MSDNRLPLLLEAAEKALVAIGDVGVYLRLQKNPDDNHAYKYLLLRSFDDNRNGLDKICKEAFEMLQLALLQFHDIDKE